VLRSVLSIIVGLVTGMTIIAIVQKIGHAMYPPPAVDWSNAEAAAAGVAQLPPGSFVMVLLAWWLGTSTGAGLGAYLASRYRWRHGWVVAGLLFLAGIAQLFALPHPGWFVVATLIVFPLSAVVGMLIGTQPVPGKREGYIVEAPPVYSKEAEESMKMM
jgi:Kef-type K+ transport system membrane component KefB